MKKLLFGLFLTLSTQVANSAPVFNGTYTPTEINQAYSNGYHAGYHNGKDDGRQQVGKAVFVVATVVVASIVIYELGRESRWATNEKGVVYRF